MVSSSGGGVITGNIGNSTIIPQQEEQHTDRECTPEELRRTVITSLAVCGFYITISSSMVFVNKSLTYTFNFRHINTLLFLQMLFTIFALRFLAKSINVVDIPTIEFRRLKQVAPVSLFYCLNALAALAALRELSVPSYTMVKRLAPLFTISLEVVLLHRRPKPLVICALIVMAIGTVLAARADVNSTTYAWMLGFSSCVFQAAYLTFVKRSGIDTGLSAVGIVYYHAFLSLPFFATMMLITGEIGIAMTYEQWFSPTFLLVLSLSLSMGLLLNYALFLCTEKTSPTSTVVSGQVKAMGQTVLGVFTFGGINPNPRYILGTCINIFGGVLYAYAKYKALASSSSSSSSK